MIGNILDNTTELYMIKYTFGEIFSSGGATLCKNPSDETVLYIIFKNIVIITLKKRFGMENFFKWQRRRRQISCGWPWKHTPWKQWSFHHDWTWKRSGFIWWVRKRFVSFFVKSMSWTFQIVWKLIHTNSKFQYVPISCELTVLNFIYFEYFL